jgi:hypothetical protein
MIRIKSSAATGPTPLRRTTPTTRRAISFRAGPTWNTTPTCTHHATEQLDSKQWASPGPVEILHWLGSSLLYTSNGNGAVDDLKAYPDSDTVPQDSRYRGLTMWDRDLLGYGVSAHNATGKDAWALLDPYDACTAPLTMTAPGANYKGPRTFGPSGLFSGKYFVLPAACGQPHGWCGGLPGCLGVLALDGDLGLCPIPPWARRRTR